MSTLRSHRYFQFKRMLIDVSNNETQLIFSLHSTQHDTHPPPHSSPFHPLRYPRLFNKHTSQLELSRANPVISTTSFPPPPTRPLVSMATSNISTLVRNSTAKVNHAINSTQVKTRTILAESKVKAGTKGKPWTNSLWACCVPFDLCMFF